MGSLNADNSKVFSCLEGAYHVTARLTAWRALGKARNFENDRNNAVHVSIQRNFNICSRIVRFLSEIYYVNCITEM